MVHKGIEGGDQLRFGRECAFEKWLEIGLVSDVDDILTEILNKCSDILVYQLDRILAHARNLLAAHSCGQGHSQGIGKEGE